MPILTPQERVGTQLAGKYRLERILASGGMATVYEGIHDWTHRAVAVKILNYEYARDEEIVRRFLQEARAASQLKHPNVVDVLDMGRDPDGTVYLVMELLVGETLKARMRRGGISIPELAALITPVMRAVAKAHEKGVVHRDIKPDNVLLARGDEDPPVITPKLLDFGIAKITQGGDSGSTRTGMMVGTPQYMAPEQVRGDRDVGPPADVWSMGVVLFACIAGRLPFEAENAAGVIARVMVETAPPLGAFAPSAPPAVVAVVERALDRDPARRFVNMGEMLGALEDALAQPSSPLVVGRAAVIAQASTLVRAPESRPPPPTTTPFAWEPTPPSLTDGPAPAPSRAMLIAAVAATSAVVIAGIGAAGWWLTRTSEPIATPLDASPTLVVPPIAPTAAPELDPVATGSPPEHAPPPPFDPAPPGPIAAEPEPVPAAEPAFQAETVPEVDPEPRDGDREAEGAPTTEADPEAAAEVEAAPHRAARASRTSDPDPARARREPRRGTRGALILH